MFTWSKSSTVSDKSGWISSICELSNFQWKYGRLLEWLSSDRSFTLHIWKWEWMLTFQWGIQKLDRHNEEVVTIAWRWVKYGEEFSACWCRRRMWSYDESWEHKINRGWPCDIRKRIRLRRAERRISLIVINWDRPRFCWIFNYIRRWAKSEKPLID